MVLTVEPQDLQTHVVWRPEKQGEKRQYRADWGRKGREDRCGGPDPKGFPRAPRAATEEVVRRGEKRRRRRRSGVRARARGQVCVEMDSGH